MQSFMGPHEPLKMAEKIAREKLIDALMTAHVSAVMDQPETVMGHIAKAHDAAENLRSIQNDLNNA